MATVIGMGVANKETNEETIIKLEKRIKELESKLGKEQKQKEQNQKEQKQKEQNQKEQK